MNTRWRRPRRAQLLSLSLAGALALAACGGDDDEPGATTAPGATTTTAGGGSGPTTTGGGGGDTTTTVSGDAPQTGGTLKLITYTEGPNFLPESHTANSPVHDLVFDRLFDVTATGEVVPALAESLEKNADGTWTLTLQDGIQFSDGTPLNAEAITGYWDLLAGDEANPCHNTLNVVASEWELVDDLTVNVTPAPQAVLDFQFALSGAKSGGVAAAGCVSTIGSPTWRTTAGDDLVSKPVGAGPYLLESWIPLDSMVFVRNPNYYQEGKPYLDRVEVKYIGDPQQRCDTFATDDSYQLMWMGNASACIGTLLGDGIEVARPALIGGIGLAFGVNNEPTNDPRVRRAIAYAMDLEDINDKAVQGQTTMVDHFIPEGSPFYVDLPAPVNDLDAAQALIDEYVAEKGGPVVIDYLLALPVKHFQDPTIQQIQQLDDVEVNVITTEGAAITQALNEKNWDAAPLSWAGPTPDLAFAAFKTGASPLWDYSNTEYDALADEAAAETDVAAKTALYEQMLEILYADMPSIPLWGSDRPSVANTGVLKGYGLRPGTFFSTYFQDLWVES